MNSNKIETLLCSPIGYFHSWQTERYMAPKQGELANEGKGKILLLPHCNYEQALEDLAGMERIWVIYWFHRNNNWKPKVQTPRAGPKRGVFATRSPHRPNPIGLSCVSLLEVKSRELLIEKSDLLDGTPILDIKPYLPYADAYPMSKQGWINEDKIQVHEVNWSTLSQQQAQFIEEHTQLPFRKTVEQRLSENPYPFPGHRIIRAAEDRYLLAFKTWRIQYSIANSQVNIEFIASGYDPETLSGLKTSRWPDLSIHQLFTKIYSSVNN